MNYAVELNEHLKKHIMGLLKTAIIGAVVYGAVKYLTKTDAITGRSIVDDIKDQAPEWINKAKSYSSSLQAKM